MSAEAVDTVTGEVVGLDPEAAARRADRIAEHLTTIADNYGAVLPLIREAIDKRDDIALGYQSPGDYISDRFGDALTGLGIEVRRSVVHELTEAGLSSRAIAPVVGVDNATVHRDRQAGVAHATPDKEPAKRPPVTGTDGKTYPARKPTFEERWAKAEAEFPIISEARDEARRDVLDAAEYLMGANPDERARREPNLERLVRAAPRSEPSPAHIAAACADAARDALARASVSARRLAECTDAWSPTSADREMFTQIVGRLRESCSVIESRLTTTENT